MKNRILVEGQKWLYKNSHPTSYLIIRKVEHNELYHVVHITIKNIVVNGEPWEITHIPIEYSALMKSLTSKTKGPSCEDEVEDFEQAFLLWKKNGGGVWNVPLDEVIKNTLITMGVLKDSPGGE